jgi:nucleoside-diphosphate-sugar epimerase
MAAAAAAHPDVVIHQMTALTGVTNFKRFDDEFAPTNRLRTEGLDHLLEAALAVGARRFIAQSYGSWNYQPIGGPVKTESDPLDPDPPAAMTRSLAAIRHLETTVVDNTDIEGVALRYGNFYGPGAHVGEGGPFLDQIRRRRFPIVGDGAGVWSFIHYDDVAMATMLAMDRGAPGIYNVLDDDPAQCRSGCPSSPGYLGRSRPGGYRPGSEGSLAARPACRCSPGSAAQPTPRPNVSWAGGCSTRAGATAFVAGWANTPPPSEWVQTGKPAHHRSTDGSGQ